MFCSRKKPPYAASLCDTPLGSATPHSRPNPNFPNLHLARYSEDAPDLARIDQELLLNLVLSETRPPRQAHDIPHGPRTRTHFPTRPNRCRQQASADSNHCGGDIESLQMLWSLRTVDHGSPETKQDARANLKLASRIERAPRLLSANKDSGPMTSSIAGPLTVPPENISEFILPARKIEFESCK